MRLFPSRPAVGVYLVQTVTLTIYGMVTLRNPSGWIDKKVYDFLDFLDGRLWLASTIILLVALLMFAAMASGARWLRALAAALALLHWSAFAWDGLCHDADAYVPYMYGCAAFGAAYALCRA